ncbi:rCG47316, isoform CRA_d [Rattus norvegicus]|uniref:RCG47316, isoform CRA_d n=1 Tax=Rattus norvegicus TaxID=10116 RepID=A6HZS4_RAT|nr:rCG47316, isoform CRA_d [Rattus norvegicus]EDM12709.1 rCG47316, isoform CRA_d [Rattus norvegicus]
MLFALTGLRYSFTCERMGARSHFKIWLMSKPFALWSQACSILQIASFSYNQGTVAT